MFTGIIEAVGAVRSLEEAEGDRRVWVDAGSLDLSDLHPGDSVAVSGACLTVTAMDANGFAADVSGETWARTAFRALRPGGRVNLEKALLPTDRIGGHFVTGHVDGVAVLRGRRSEARSEARSERFVLEVPVGLSRFLAEKGTIAVDGVSLTVNEVSGGHFGVNLVPHTLAHTNLSDRETGEPLNIEADLLARYLDSLMRDREKGEADRESGLTEEFLRDARFRDDPGPE